MRSNNNFYTTVFALGICAVMCSVASAQFNPVVFFNFPGWDDALVSSGSGQDFLNVYNGVDVNVKLTKAPGATPSSVTNGKVIGDGHLTNSGAANTFVFTFTEPLQLVTQFLTVDSQESVSISGDGIESFSHIFGALPTITPHGDGVLITGNGVGITPTGASNGQILTGPTSTLTIAHTPLGSFANKFEYYMVGVLVPEPASMSMVGVCLIGALSILRRRR